MIEAMRLPPRWRKLLLIAHVIGGVGWLGAELVLLALAISGARGTDPQTIYPAAAYIGTWVVAPLAVLSLCTGLLQGPLTPWGLVTHWWVTIKLVLTAVMTGLVFFALLPALRAAVGESLTAADRVNLVVAPSVASSLLLLNTVLAVYKPGGRIRARRG